MYPEYAWFTSIIAFCQIVRFSSHIYSYSLQKTLHVSYFSEIFRPNVHYENTVCFAWFTQGISDVNLLHYVWTLNTYNTIKTLRSVHRGGKMSQRYVTPQPPYLTITFASSCRQQWPTINIHISPVKKCNQKLDQITSKTFIREMSTT